jgi:hypothetical protein
VSGRKFIPNPVEHRRDGTTVLFIDYKNQVLHCTIDTTDYSMVSNCRWFEGPAAGTIGPARGRVCELAGPRLKIDEARE